MAENDPPPDDYRQLKERVDWLEEVLHQQIARVFALEKRLGVEPTFPRPEPVSAPPKPPPLAAAPVAARGGGFSFEGKDLESLIGGNWFNRIGILAIILSVGFFLKYAFENQWIGPAGRVAIGVAIGLGFLAGGERLRGKGYRYYAHGLSGGGIAILYLAFFAAFARYLLIGRPTALALMSAVTVAAVLLAVRSDALAIAVLGLLGGFLTPILLSTGQDNQIGLFSYIVLLDLGALAVAWRKQWRALQYLAFGATVLLSAAWLEEWYSREKFGLTVFFFTLLYLLFALPATVRSLLHRVPASWSDIGLITINALVYFIAILGVLDTDHRVWQGAFAVAIAIFHLALGSLAQRAAAEDRSLAKTFFGLAALFLTLFLPIQLDRHWVTMGWAVEGAALTWIGLRTGSRWTRYAALVVFAASGIHWLAIDWIEFGFPGQADFGPIFNRRAVSALVLAACLGAVAWRHRRRADEMAARERDWIAGACFLVANGVLLLWLSGDLHDFYARAKAALLARTGDDPGLWSGLSRMGNEEQLAMTGIWMGYGIGMFILGFVRRFPLSRQAGLVLIGATIVKVFLVDLSDLDQIYRVISFVALGAILLAISFLYQRREKRIE
ncbi:MAG: DUF2339 domain-containing protein [Blastocatellia bacterium]|nr:DUF2339 domain-containing protein [Blastocatellia bacterium]